MRCWQISGGHRSDEPHAWDLLLVENIQDLRDAGTCFAGPRDGYRPGHKAMSTIYAEL